jgi:hypothetical protein
MSHSNFKHTDPYSVDQMMHACLVHACDSNLSQYFAIARLHWAKLQMNCCCSVLLIVKDASVAFSPYMLHQMQVCNVPMFNIC